jgi:uncharacterized protein (TIGR03790 family)
MAVVKAAVAALGYALAWAASANAVARSPVAAAPRIALAANDLAVIVNDVDRLSVEIGEYYRGKRGIPSQNVIHVRFDATQATLSESQFAKVNSEVLARTPPGVQAYALTWASPYRVECMSITTAFALGFDPAFCSKGCATTRRSPYFNADSRRPFTDLALRPTMSIAATTFTHARELIDRGVASDGTAPRGTGYLVSTDDAARNVRAAGYSDAALMVDRAIRLEVVHAPVLENKQDVLFYFIGASNVAKLDTNRFLPGAVADHLTSFGGDLNGSSQMSSLRWLEAGATGSYGTVAEPCNILGKFPSPGMLMKRYLAGETLIEAYWKSVAMPGQGLFIGEPLAKPFGSRR